MGKRRVELRTYSNYKRDKSSFYYAIIVDCELDLSSCNLDGIDPDPSIHSSIVPNFKFARVSASIERYLERLIEQL